ncbi:MAG: LytR family transcriptional regulator, partial [Nocardioides sp.]|nr:LytR family transcriptional regulator [Nocardioides sp.]
DALWFARSREGSDDYSRMARQKCVMNAMATQIDPKTLLTHYEDITSAGKAMVETNLPSNEFPRFLDLALKAKGQPISTVSIVPPTINTADPDMEKIRSMISDAIDQAEGNSGGSGHDSGDDSGDKPRKKATKPGSTTNGGSLGTRDDGYVANDSEDLAAAC